MLLRKPILNVNLFSGKGFDFRGQMMYYLAMNKESTTWDIAQFISQEEIRLEPSRKSMITKSHLAGVYRNINERMIPQKYVRQNGTRISKGTKSPTYGLSFRGSLVVLYLPLKTNEFQKILENNLDVNPFYNLINMLKDNGMNSELCDKVILKGLINGVKNNLINLSTNNESIIGQSVIPTLAVHLDSINKPELKKFKNTVDKIWDKKFSDNMTSVLHQFSGIVLNPLFWSAWKENEDSQLMTLYYLADITLNPKQYEKLVDTTSKPEYDESLNIEVET